MKRCTKTSGRCLSDCTARVVLTPLPQPPSVSLRDLSVPCQNRVRVTGQDVVAKARELQPLNEDDTLAFTRWTELNQQQQVGLITYMWSLASILVAIPDTASAFKVTNTLNGLQDLLAVEAETNEDVSSRAH